MSYSLIASLDQNHEVAFTLNTTIAIGRGNLRFVARQLYLPVGFISRTHCTLILKAPDEHSDRAYFAIKDGNRSGEKSKNGTWVNGDRIINEISLKHQDVITFAGGSVFPAIRFINHSAINEAGDLDTAQHEYSLAE